MLALSFPKPAGAGHHSYLCRGRDPWPSAHGPCCLEFRPGELLYLDLWGRKTQTVAVQRAQNCPTCVAREFQFLRTTSSTNTLCGDAIQIVPREKTPLDLVALAKRLRHLGHAEVKHGLLFLEIEGASFTVFPDGRALIKGITDPNKAQALYDRFIAR